MILTGWLSLPSPRLGTAAALTIMEDLVIHSSPMLLAMTARSTDTLEDLPCASVIPAPRSQLVPPVS